MYFSRHFIIFVINQEFFKMKFYSLILAAALLLWNSECHAQLSDIQPLWPNGIPGNPVKYKTEKLTSNAFRQSSLSQSNRVFSCVSEPGYIYSKGGHGFDSGVERGNGIASWRESFVSWLKDRGFISEK